MPLGMLKLYCLLRKGGKIPRSEEKMATANQSYKVKVHWYIMTYCSFNNAIQIHCIPFHTCVCYLQVLYYDPHTNTYMMDLPLSLYPRGPQ